MSADIDQPHQLDTVTTKGFFFVRTDFYRSDFSYLATAFTRELVSNYLIDY
jgi:hypothetical protein